MKRILITLGILFLFTIPSSFAQFNNDLTGEMLIGGYLGYSIGMGDAFSDYEDAYATMTRNAGIGFGGTFYYGVKENMMVGGELMFQHYGVDIENKTTAPYTYPGENGSSSTKLSILANGLYAFNSTDDAGFFLCAGIGLYDYGGMKLGLNAGVLYRKLISEKLYLYGSPRFHLVLASSTFELLQLAVGVQYMLGAD
jgi:opacity protein-like surface antigen